MKLKQILKVVSNTRIEIMIVKKRGVSIPHKKTRIYNYDKCWDSFKDEDKRDENKALNDKFDRYIIKHGDSEVINLLGSEDDLMTIWVDEV